MLQLNYLSFNSRSVSVAGGGAIAEGGRQDNPVKPERVHESVKGLGHYYCHRKPYGTADTYVRMYISIHKICQVNGERVLNRYVGNKVDWCL